jgi:hypothetical protein
MAKCRLYRKSSNEKNTISCWMVVLANSQTPPEPDFWYFCKHKSLQPGEKEIYKMVSEKACITVYAQLQTYKTRCEYAAI